MKKFVLLMAVTVLTCAAIAAGAKPAAKSTAAGTARSCSVCGKAIKPGKSYLQGDGRIFCGQACVDRTRPKCTLCGKAVSKGGRFGGPKGPLYCMVCLKTPRCSSCNLPAKCKPLDDGRPVCAVCSKTAILKPADAQALFEEVRKAMKVHLSLATDHPIKLILTDVHTLRKKAGGTVKGREQGYYCIESIVHTLVTTQVDGDGKKRVIDKKVSVKKTYTIYVLYGLSRARAREIVAHELGHDWLEAHYPGIWDLKTIEGWAEYAASLVNTHYGCSEMNKQMAANPDPI